MVFIILNKIKCVLKITEVMDHLMLQKELALQIQNASVYDWKCDGWGYKKCKSTVEVTPYKHSQIPSCCLKIDKRSKLNKLDECNKNMEKDDTCPDGHKYRTINPDTNLLIINIVTIYQHVPKVINVGNYNISGLVNVLIKLLKKKITKKIQYRKQF